MAKAAHAYAAAGVDIDAADRAKQRIKQLARATFSRGVLAEIGGFGGLFRLPAGLRQPVLVASMDGVGTKLKVAFALGRHDTVGRDLVNHCVNDILVQGARPLFFLDYVALGRMEPRVVTEVVAGVAQGCRENGCALLGGESAEMPGFYAPGEYDVAGCIVGVVERRRLLTGAGIRRGDRLIGLRSAGLHTNGYSLARKLVEQSGYGYGRRVPALGTTAGEALLTEHRSYLRALWPLLAARPCPVRGLAHITGGGITDNLPRILPPGCGARIDTRAWTPPALFAWLQRLGGVADEEMRRTFNLGIGMIVVAAASAAAGVMRSLRARGEAPVEIGEIVAGRRGVRYR